MNKKKTRDANLDRFRVPLLFLGLLFSSAIVLTAFEWKTYVESPTVATDLNWRELPPEPIFTAVAMKKPPPPPPAPKPIVDEYLKVKDDKLIDIDFVMPDIKFKDEPIPLEIAQKKEDVTEEIFDGFRVSVLPEFPGGDPARMDFLRQNIRYPIKEKRAGIQGTVWIEFVVGKDGKIEDAHVLHGIGEGCDEEALRVVNEMPKWTPGKQRGIPVRVRFQMPVTYSLK